MIELKITTDTKNQRLDKFLGKYLNDAPMSFIYKMLRKKNIKLNGKKAVGSEILCEDDIVRIFIADDTIDKFRSEKSVGYSVGDIDIVYEDANILVLNKPRGLLTHPDSVNAHDTLLARTLSYLHQKGDYDTSKESVFTPGFCNRLDRNTTGIVVCGKTLNASQQLNKAISSGNSEKYYSAIVIGEVRSRGVLKGFHTKDQKANKVSISDAGDKEVVTEYEPIMTHNGYSLLKIKLVTGRSHQIRAHLSGIGYPILGDTKYGIKSVKVLNTPKFQMLHSTCISFSSLGDGLEYLNNTLFTASEPQDFKYYSNKLFGGILSR